MQGVDAVVHLAAHVHVMDESVADPLSTFRRVNVKGTKRLAQQAIDANVRRFFYELCFTHFRPKHLWVIFPLSQFLLISAQGTFG